MEETKNNVKRAVIFDLDGTILDTVWDITDNINLMLKDFGYAEVTVKEVRKFVGSGARKLVKDCVKIPLSEEQLDERLKVYNGYYTASVSPKTKVFDGIKETVVALKKRGYKLAILTNKPQETTDTVYREHMSDFGFDEVVGQSGSVKCKPDKAATMRILDKFGVAPENAYFVGDGETDTITAQNSGTQGIAVLWGYRDREDLEKVGATVFAKTPEDLLSIIPEYS